LNTDSAGMVVSLSDVWKSGVSGCFS
jgi:hypothetical protein